MLHNCHAREGGHFLAEKRYATKRIRSRVLFFVYILNMTSMVRLFCILLLALAPQVSFAQGNEEISDSLSSKLTLYQTADKSGGMYVGEYSNESVGRVDPQVKKNKKRVNWVFVTSLTAIGWSLMSCFFASQYEDDADNLVKETSYRNMSDDEYHRRRSKIKSKQSDRNFWYVNTAAGAIIGVTAFTLWYTFDF